MNQEDSEDLTSRTKETLPGRPASLADLYFSLNSLALQGFGGVLAVVQRELVERKKWLTQEEFLEEWAVAQVLPGPNVANLVLMIGHRYFGWRGALVALAGMLAVPLLIVLVLAVLFAGVADIPEVQGALRGMGIVTAGMLTAMGLKLVGALKKNVMGTPVCTALAAMTFIAIAVLRFPLAAVLIGLGSVACLWTYQRIGALEAGANSAGDMS